MKKIKIKSSVYSQTPLQNAIRFSRRIQLHAGPQSEVVTIRLPGEQDLPCPVGTQLKNLSKILADF